MDARIFPVASAGPGDSRRFFARPPAAALAIALLAALLHMLPIWRAQATTPTGWTFTGNVSDSPDYMQYRVWERQAPDEGAIVTNKLTTEPHSAYLPVFFYWAVGTLARATGAQPEFVFAYAGALLALLLALLVFLTLRWFAPSPAATWWTFLAVMFGGGLGAHLKLVARELAGSGPPGQGLLARALEAAPVFESYRSHYVVKTLFDTHFLLIWLLTLGAVLAHYFALRRTTPARLLALALLCAATTLIHVYEGPLLLGIAAAVTALCLYRRVAVRSALATFGAGAAGVAASLTLLLLLQRSSGLPIPAWSPPNVLLSSVLLAYPIAWLVIAPGIVRYLSDAALDELFLCGWALGCTAMTLSSPYYPYADRGPMTLQVPLYAIAGAIWFARRGRVPLGAALVALAALGATPLLVIQHQWRAARFDPGLPSMFMDAEHRAAVALLAGRASARDVLLCDYRDYRWLAPEYPGLCYHGHFFLTVDFERKSAEVERFFAAPPGEQEAFLRRERIRFLYVNASREPQRFERLAGAARLWQSSDGALFEFAPDAAPAPR